MIGPDKGDGSYQQACAVAEELRVPVHFLGRVPKNDIPKWIDGGDLFLNTTTIDNTPVTVVEAMACGACVVSTNVGGIPHLAADGVVAVRVPPRDPEAMAAAIERVLGDRELAMRMSRSARARVDAFDWSAVLPQWTALLRSISSERPAGARLGLQTTP
jgi:glycosyltransferase involved in cell wall biosynthesis